MINALLLSAAVYVLWQQNIRTSVNVLLNSNTALHLFLASTLGITLLAFLKTGTLLTMPLHFIGLTCTTLILGKRLMLLSCCISAFALAITQKLMFEDLGIFLIASLIVPVLIFELFRSKFTSLVKKPWQFILIIASLGAVISFIVKTFINSVYYYLVNDIPLTDIIDNYLLLSFLFWIPEMMLNGTLIMILIQHKPHWIASYHLSHSNTDKN